jgi:hypothetical protein
MSTTSILPYIQQCLTRYGITGYLILGDIGLLFNIAIFSQPTHRRNPSSLYILAMSLCALIGLNMSVVPIIYALYQPDPSTTSFVFCLLQRYLRHSFNQMMRTFFVLACADRYMVTSHNARIRSFSRYRVAIWSIPCVISFWLILSFFPTIFASLVNNACNPTTGLFAIVSSIYFPTVVGGIPLTCMVIFGILLLSNMKGMRRRVQPFTNANPPINQLLRKRDRDMLKMLLVELVCYLITTTPLTIMLIYSAITRTATKGTEQRQIESFLTYLNNTFLLYMNNCQSFWIYICASRSFRLELKTLLMKMFGFITGKQMQRHETNTT